MLKVHSSIRADVCSGRGWLLHHLRPWISAFGGRAGAAPRSRRGCSIAAFSKITQQSKFIVSQTKLACYWQSSIWTVNSFYLSKKLWLGSLAPFFSACFLKRNKLSAFPRPPSSHLSWARARSAVSILWKVRGPLSRDQWRSFYQHFIKAHKSLPRPWNRNMCPKYVDLQNVFISLGYFISPASCDINST